MCAVQHKDPDILLLGIYQKVVPPSHKDTFSTMSIADLFIKVRIRKQHRHSLTKEWIKKTLYKMEYYSAINNKDILLETKNIILSEET